MNSSPRTCARCTRTGVKFAVTWPEGSICRRCHQRITRIHGFCPGCGEQRLLPGLSPSGEKLCVDCANIPANFHCTRCGVEDEPVRTGLCARCCLKDDLGDLLRDEHGGIAAHMLPLYQALTTQANARSARVWMITNKPATKLLRALATGRASLTHETFTQHPTPGKVQHLRAHMMSLGMIEEHNRRIERYETWLNQKLLKVPSPKHKQLITQFTTFVHLNRMRHLARQDALKEGTLLNARQSTSTAIEFLGFLDGRGKDPDECTQQDINEWLAGGPTTRSLARTFARWVMGARHIPKLDFPYRVAKTLPRLSQDRRLELIRRALDDHELYAGDRAACLLMLLFGQALTRVAAMKMEQFLHSDDGDLQVVFGEDPIEVPAVFSTVFKDYLANRPNTNTASNPGSPWCFPGFSPGEHISANHLMNRLREVGIDLKGAKNATLQELVLLMPPAIAADALGYSYQVMDIHEQRAGARWKAYSELVRSQSKE